MTIPSLFDPTMARLQYGLVGMSQRQQTIADNIANVDTPGYLTHDIPFEQTLLASMSNGMDNPAGTPPPLPGTITRNDLKVRNDGNNVDIDQQMTQMAETTLQYQTASSLISDKFSMLAEALAPTN